jgi:hypothetical protein
VQRGLAAVATSSLVLVDVRDAAKPILHSTLALTGGDVVDVSLSPSLVLAATTGNLVSVNVSAPDSPKQLGATLAALKALALARHGDFAFVADEARINTVAAWRVGNPKQIDPVAGLVDFSSLAQTDALDLAASGSHLFAIDAGKLFVGRFLAFSDGGPRPPDVRVLTPSGGTAIDEGARVDVEVLAEDDVGVSEVRLLLDGEPAGALFAPPYRFSFRTPPVSQKTALTIESVAADFGGNVGRSGPTTIFVSPVADMKPPTAFLLSPQDAMEVPAGGTLSALISGADNVGISRARLLVDGALAGTALNPPFVIPFTVPNKPAGKAVKLEAEVEDYGGNKAKASANLTIGALVATLKDKVIDLRDQTLEGKDLDIVGPVTIDGAHSFKRIRVFGGGVLTHLATGLTLVPSVNLKLASLWVGVDGAIDVTGRGYLGACSGANAQDARPRSSGNTGTAYGSIGGSHGGPGGQKPPSTANPPYDVASQPTDPGGGGGNGLSTCSGPVGGDGGGLIKLTVVGKAHIDGRLAADGAQGILTGGGGAGGAVILDANAIGGKGQITANGGGADPLGNGVGGGGGRVVLRYAKNELARDQARAEGGAGPTPETSGGPGTVLAIEALTSKTRAIFANGGRASVPTPMPILPAGTDVTIAGATVEVAGAATYSALQLESGAALSHPRATTTTAPKIDVKLASLFIDSTSRMDVSGRGYLGACSAENTDPKPRTSGNNVGLSGSVGGSYGGPGGHWGTSVPSLTFGDATAPSEGGGGGGNGTTSCPGAGASGGGYIRLIVSGIAKIDGVIQANGENGVGTGGGGAGGGISMELGTLDGSGRITAAGGDGDPTGAGISGGGGRIYLKFNSSRMPKERIRVEGGLGKTPATTGGPGSVVLMSTASATTNLIMAGGRRLSSPTRLPSVPNITAVSVVGASVDMVQPVTWRSLELKGQSHLGHPAVRAVNATVRVDFTVGSLNIDTTSDIDTTARGFAGACSGDNFAEARPRTGGNTLGRAGSFGGSHGGPGGTLSPSAANLSYDDPLGPSEPGGGGGNGGTTCGPPGGNGGGVVKLTVRGVAQVDGAIRVNGDAGVGSGGGGAGGSIVIDALTLAGVGKIDANGGDGDLANSGISGGGGRIYLKYGNATMPVSAIRAEGGVGKDAERTGGPGTVVIADTRLPRPQFIISGGGRPSAYTPLPGMPTGTNVSIIGALVDVTRGGNLGSLELKSGAVVSHPPTGVSAFPKLDLTLSRLLVDSTSRIDVSGRGFLGACSAENGNDPRPRSSSNTSVGAGSVGGSHLGPGGQTGTAQAGPPYDDPTAPAEAGGGGGNGASTCPGPGSGASGGGVVRLKVNGTAHVDGAIVANGVAARTPNGGGGAGGTVLLEAATLSGNGRIEANGGAGDLTGAGISGGGGAVYLKAATRTLPAAQIQAEGGAGSSAATTGGPGTVVLAGSSSLTTTLFVSQGGRPSVFTPLPTFQGGINVTIDGAGVETRFPILLRSLELKSGAVMTHVPATTTTTRKVDLRLGSLLIDATSRLDASERGFLGACSGANFRDARPRTIGNVLGRVGRLGGSHGGPGGSVLGVSVANPTYGDALNPAEPGGGGGNGTNACPGLGPNGGGVIQLAVTGTAQVDGAILTNGGRAKGSGGGAAGGTLFMEIGTLKGAGKIEASGGDGDPQGAGISGGGGRIFLRSTNLQLPVANIRAEGGVGSTPAGTGGAGTILFANAISGVMSMNIVGGGRASAPTPLSTIPGNTTVTVSGAAIEFSATATLGALVLKSGSILAHPGATLAATPRIDLRLASLVIDPTSKIDVTGRGYLGACSGDNGVDPRPRTTLNTALLYGSLGGSHGGLGGLFGTTFQTNPAYGDPAAPAEPGGGGGSGTPTCTGTSGGNGGGQVKLTIAGAATVDGAIIASGSPAKSTGGGGAGGSISIEAAKVDGAGRIEAQGGSAEVATGGIGGGGGRIAVLATQAGTFPLTGFSAAGGDAGSAMANGGAGTLYYKLKSASSGDLTVDAAGRASRPGSTPLVGTSGYSFANVFIQRKASFRSTSPIGIAGGKFQIQDASATLDAPVIAPALELLTGATLTHSPATILATPSLNLFISGVVAVDGTSAIDVSGRGYVGAGPFAGTCIQGRTSGNNFGSANRGGGSYGGLGGAPQGSLVNPVHGSNVDPKIHGSGGGATACTERGGNGGGVLKLAAGTVELDGAILSDGNSTTTGGGGSGGSIRIDAPTLLSPAGTGVISAVGGAGAAATGGGGGGGRIAIYATNRVQFPTKQISVKGGTGGVPGGGGTIVLSP